MEMKKEKRNIFKYWNQPPKGRYLSVKEVGALGLCAFGASGFYNFLLYFVVTIIFIPYFYEIESIHAYIILICGNTLNMFMQPIIGNALEKTNTKIGRYKPYIIGVLPFLITFTILATYVPQGFDKTSRIIYAYCTCIPAIMLISFGNNMYQTMPTVATPNNQERADILTPLGLLYALSPTIVSLIIGPIRSAFTGREYLSLRILGIIMAVVSAGCMLFVLQVKERSIEVSIPKTKSEKLSIWHTTKLLAKNKPLIIMSIALCLGSLREFWRFFLQFYAQTRFSANVNDALNTMGLPLTIMGFGVFISVLFIPILTRKFSKNIVLIFFSSINTVACSIIGFVGFQNIPVGTSSLVAITILFLMASFVSAIFLALPSVIGDVADYQQFLCGKRLEGHIQNFMLTIPLLFSQIVMLGLSFVQSSVGFEPKDYTVDNMQRLADGSLVPYSQLQQLTACRWFNIACIVSAVSSALTILVLIFYPLSKKKHKQIMEKLSSKTEEPLPKENFEEESNKKIEI